MTVEIIRSSRMKPAPKGRRLFTSEEKARLLAEYEDHADRNKLDHLSEKMQRSKALLSRHALKLGLTDSARTKPNAADNFPSAMPHPRGMAGKKHSDQTLDRMSAAQFRRWHSMSPSARAAFASTSKRSWRAGWRTVGGKRIYFRSRWEANYARYLEWLRERKQIKSWDHEPKTFWFEEIRRGTRSYLPDFLVVELNDAEAFHEVKGWMDSASKTKIKRMAKYYPSVRLIVIDTKAYKSIAAKMANAIPGWES